MMESELNRVYPMCSTQTIANMGTTSDPAYSSDVAKEVPQKRYLNFLDCHVHHMTQKVLRTEHGDEHCNHQLEQGL